ncbi:MAG: undecaprenyl diphosphate synthase family protein, partial [Clostridia bacterium]
ASCKTLTLNIALNYGGQEEILQAVNKAICIGKPVDGVQFENLLYTAGQPNPDVIVRASGEHRLSNFLLYQSAYAELIFVNALWPDFNKKQIEKILTEYSCRDRRYGGCTLEE